MKNEAVSFEWKNEAQIYILEILDSIDIEVWSWNLLLNLTDKDWRWKNISETLNWTIKTIYEVEIELKGNWGLEKPHLKQVAVANKCRKLPYSSYTQKTLVLHLLACQCTETWSLDEKTN